MRSINLNEVKEILPQGWEERAESAYGEIREVLPEDRIKAINDRAVIWQELKFYLDKFSNGKCWYCESIQDRSDNAVDHFRPKGKVTECPKSTHYGYWWLAFRWRNYRFSCTFCNSRRRDLVAGTCGGKQNHFPLLNEDSRAQDETDDIELELPYLLDPTDELDPGLLSFNMLGEAVPTYNEQTRAHQRALKSIELYNLNYYKTKQKRSDLYRYINRLIKSGNRYFERHISDAPDKDVDNALMEVILELENLISKKAEFSAAARVYILGLRGNGKEWLDIVFRRAES